MVVFWMLLTRTVRSTVVPDVVGKSESQALDALEEADLTVKVERHYRRVEEQGKIYRQTPRPGLKVRTDRAVRIWVSLGPAEAVMPDLAGVSLTESKNILRQIGRGDQVHGGLVLSRTAWTYHSNVDKDHVVAQDPPPGEKIHVGDPVQLLLSLGPLGQPTIVPDVRGLPEAQARAALEAAGLTVQRVLRQISSDSPNTVLAVDPPPGEPLDKGEFVSLTVSMPAVTPQDRTRRTVLVRYIVPLLLERKEFQLMLADRSGDRLIYSGKPNPGQVLDFAEPVIGDASLKVYIDDILSQIRNFRAPIDQ